MCLPLVLLIVSDADADEGGVGPVDEVAICGAAVATIVAVGADVSVLADSAPKRYELDVEVARVGCWAVFFLWRSCAGLLSLSVFSSLSELYGASERLRVVLLRDRLRLSCRRWWRGLFASWNAPSFVSLASIEPSDAVSMSASLAASEEAEAMKSGSVWFRL